MTLTVYAVGALTGGVDLTPYVAPGGFKWQRSDLDSDDAGRTLDGVMHRDRIDIKYSLEVKCRPLTLSEASTVLTAIEPEWIDVVYTDPRLGTTVRRTMYSNNVPATHLITKGGVDYWDGIEFPLIEQ